MENVGKCMFKVVVKGTLQRLQRRAELWRTLDIYENYVENVPNYIQQSNDTIVNIKIALKAWLLERKTHIFEIE